MSGRGGGGRSRGAGGGSSGGGGRAALISPLVWPPIDLLGNGDWCKLTVWFWSHCPCIGPLTLKFDRVTRHYFKGKLAHNFNDDSFL